MTASTLLRARITGHVGAPRRRRVLLPLQVFEGLKQQSRSHAWSGDDGEASLEPKRARHRRAFSKQRRGDQA
jgi:hypothetical protein